MFFSVLYLILLIVINSESQHCENFNYKSELDNGCLPVDDTTNCKYDGCNMRMVDVTYDLVDTIGLVMVNFTLPPYHCCYTHYEVELLVDEEVADESTCISRAYLIEKHSMKIYDVCKCEGDNCDVDGSRKFWTLPFNYVYSGCYQLRIIPYKRTSTQASIYSKPFYIKTNFTKEKIAGPVLVSHYRAKEERYDLKLAYPQSINKSKIEFHFCGNDSSVNKGTVTVMAGIESNNSVCVPVGSYLDSRCLYMFDEVRCTFYNITPGNYCIRIYIVDDRCEEGTVWTKNNSCRWSTVLEILQQPPDVPFASIFPYVSNAVTICLILIGAVLLIVLAVLLLKKRNLKWSLTPGEPPDEMGRPLGLKLKVLLLYPRDCNEFMNVMNSLRLILNKFDNVEVFDCYQDEEVLNGPFLWLQRLMSQTRLCTVVVNSECAYLLQNAMKLGTSADIRSYYKEPSFRDPVFLYGLKLIMEDISPDIYHKNFVIGLENFSKDEHMLTLPTNFRRYIIPNHLQKLLSDMSVEHEDENFFLLDSPEYFSLENNLRILNEFKSKHPDYLENLLNLI